MYYVPQSLTEWAQMLASFDPCCASLRSTIELHMALHQAYGKRPDIAVVEGERKLSLALESFGIPHRHRDALAEMAGTNKEAAGPLTIREVACHLQRTLVIASSALRLVQEQSAARPMYLQVASPDLKGLAPVILKAINQRLPPGTNIKLLPAKASKNFVEIYPLYDLALGQCEFYQEAAVSTWEGLAVLDEKVIKTAFPFQIVLKQDQAQSVEERYTKGVVLEPGLVDNTSTTADGKPTGAQGDMLEPADIREACFWWMEHSRFSSYYHMQHGGIPLMPGDVTLLENYILDADAQIGPRWIKAGSWVQSYRVYNDTLWQEVLKGQINGWSMGAFHKSEMVEVDMSKSA